MNRAIRITEFFIDDFVNFSKSYCPENTAHLFEMYSPMALIAAKLKSTRNTRRTNIFMLYSMLKDKW